MDSSISTLSGIEKFNTIPRGLKLAIREAEKSEYRFKMGAICMKGNRILSRGYNQIRHLSIGSSKYSLFKESLHAERHCLSQLDKEDIKGATLYIGRVYADGSQALAQPCDQCFFMINDLSVSKIIFTVDEFPYYEEVKL